MAIEFRGSWRQDKERDVLLPASLLKPGLKLRASVYLYCLHREGHPPHKAIQESLSYGGGGSGVHLQHVPTTDYIAGSEMLEHYPRYRA